ncbi:MAG: dicarboxylate/amino acid:cation symporter [Gammaproteobacteria bacterium]
MNSMKMALWKKIFIGMVAGIITGSLLGSHADFLKPIGDLFIVSIKMLIVPLVFCSLVCGITSMKDIRKMGRIGLKTFTIYLLTSFIAIGIGLALGGIGQPGLNTHIDISAFSTGSALLEQPPSLSFANIIPENPLQALTSGNILQIIVFSTFLGLAMVMAGKKAQPLVNVFTAGAETMCELAEIVMSFAPYGVFALMAWLAGSQGLGTLLSLLKVIVMIYVGYLTLALLIYAPILKYVAGLSPRLFLKHILEAIVTSFTTSSSMCALPVSMRCAQKNIGVSKNLASFILPLGATINMNGTALYIGVSTLFIAQIFDISLATTDYMLITVTAVFAAIGTAGVPGAGVIMLSLALAAVNIPVEGIALMLAIDRIIDMGRSTINIIGDLVVATLVSQSEGEFSEAIYNNQLVPRAKEVPSRS